MIRRIAPLVLALAAAPVRAGPVEDGQIWININAQGPLAGRLLYYAELQPRFFDGGGEIGQVLVRPAIGWKLSERVSVFQGYAHVANPGMYNEERSFQQLSWSAGTVAGGRFSTRTRLEQRWRSDGADVALRLRHLVRWAHPLGRDPKRSVAAVVSLEPFVTLNRTDWGGRSRFDQLRSNVALEIPLTGKTTLEAGYLNQYAHRLGQPDQVNHIAQIVLALRP